MKKGIARRAKLSRPVAIRWATVVKAGMALILNNMVAIVAKPMQKEIGTPIERRTKKQSARTQMCKGSILKSHIPVSLKGKDLVNCDAVDFPFNSRIVSIMLTNA
jgi:hypothetical protein